MQDNVQNNWRQSLENDDTFPDEIIKDKNAAWEKLYTRLHKKSIRKYFIPYWAAAACIAMAIITAIIFLNSEKHQPSSSITGSSPIINRMPPASDNALSTEPKQRTKISSQASIKFISSISLRQKKITVKKKESENKNGVVVYFPDKEILTETINQPPLQFDSVKEITTIAPAKKKLRVIHINDLGQPMEESTADNPFVERHKFQWRIAAGENYNPISTSPPNNGLIFFKSKNTSN